MWSLGNLIFGHGIYKNYVAINRHVDNVDRIVMVLDSRNKWRGKLVSVQKTIWDGLLHDSFTMLMP